MEAVTPQLSMSSVQAFGAFMKKNEVKAPLNSDTKIRRQPGGIQVVIRPLYGQWCYLDGCGRDWQEVAARTRVYSPTLAG